MGIDILIDKLTDCLEVTETGEIVDTYYREVTDKINRNSFKGWKFNWLSTQQNGYTVFELYVKGDDRVQGRISMKIDGGVADVDIVETAPHNYGRNGFYTGVGGHLFAIACKFSQDNGCDGYVAFTAKSDLIQYYHDNLGAELATGRRMFLDESAAQFLISKYLERE